MCGTCSNLTPLPVHMADVPDSEEKEDFRLLWAVGRVQDLHGRLVKEHTTILGDLGEEYTVAWLEVLLQEPKVWTWRGR